MNANDIVEIAETINKFSLPLMIALYPLAKMAKCTKTKVDDKIIGWCKDVLAIIRTGPLSKNKT